MEGGNLECCRTHYINVVPVYILGPSQALRCGQITASGWSVPSCVLFFVSRCYVLLNHHANFILLFPRSFFNLSLRHS